MLGDRPASTMSREITKLYEETRRGKISTILESIKESGQPKG